jgi:hypothetical protein
LLGRRADVRASLVGILLAFIAGAVVAGLGGAPAPVGALLGAAGAAVVLAPAGLAAGGLLEDGRWLWASVPAPRGLVVGASVVGAGLLLVPWVGVAVGVGVLVEGASGSEVLAFVGAIAGSWGCALVAGMLVPWSRAGIGEQGAALAVFATLAAAASLVVTRLGPELVELGVSAAGIALTLPLVPVAVAIALGGRRLARVA